LIPHSRPSLGEEEKRVCQEVLSSLQIAQGPKVEEFEKNLCDFVHRRYAISVSSGTSALSLSLSGLGVTRGDEVIMPSYTCAALLHAVDSVDARPVLVDVDADDLNVSVTAIKKKIGKKTKAIIVPHLFGRAAQIDEIVRLGVPVIEDGTQALGASVNGKSVGNFGEVSVFSFYATKMITTGEGGMVLTNSRKLARWINDARDYDKKSTYHFRTNSKMTDLEAAIGIEQLKKLPEFIAGRQKIAVKYQDAFQGLDLQLPFGDAKRNHVYFRYVIRAKKNNKILIRELTDRGIEAKKPIFKPLHRYLNLADSGFPVTINAMKNTCSLPIFPLMDSQSINAVCDAVPSLIKHKLKKELMHV